MPISYNILYGVIVSYRRSRGMNDNFRRDVVCAFVCACLCSRTGNATRDILCCIQSIYYTTDTLQNDRKSYKKFLSQCRYIYLLIKLSKEQFTFSLSHQHKMETFRLSTFCFISDAKTAPLECFNTSVKIVDCI